MTVTIFFQEALKFCRLFYDVLCYRYYTKIVVDNFAHQIKSEYYGGNISISLEATAMEHFSAPTHI